jgi:hypothetical protein
MSPSRHRAVLTTLTVALATAACASAPITRQDPFEGPRSDEEVMLTVHNHDTRNATIYAHWSGLKERIGSVVGMQSATFRMKWRSEQIQLGIEFLGSIGGYRTGTVDVTQGDHLDYVILARR